MGWGKLIGFIIGYSLGGWFLGLLGLAIGHISDFLRNNRFIQQARQSRQFFFEMTFLVMGHVAKADGHVSENEINAARMLMQRMNLNNTQCIQAMQLFNQGKQSDFNLEKTLANLINMSQGNFILLQLFADMQLQAAKLSGKISSSKQKVLNMIFQQLGYQPFEYFSFTESAGFHEHTDRYTPFQRTEYSAREDYALLGISETASNDDIKKAYRKLINQHHPDKLIAKGLPEEMLKIATEKAQTIQLAYDRLRKIRNF